MQQPSKLQAVPHLSKPFPPPPPLPNRLKHDMPRRDLSGRLSPFCLTCMGKADPTYACSLPPGPVLPTTPANMQNRHPVRREAGTCLPEDRPSPLYILGIAVGGLLGGGWEAATMASHTLPLLVLCPNNHNLGQFSHNICFSHNLLAHLSFRHTCLEPVDSASHLWRTHGTRLQVPMGSATLLSHLTCAGIFIGCLGCTPHTATLHHTPTPHHLRAARTLLPLPHAHYRCPRPHAATRHVYHSTHWLLSLRARRRLPGRRGHRGTRTDHGSLFTFSLCWRAVGLGPSRVANLVSGLPPLFAFLLPCLSVRHLTWWEG